MHVRLLARSRHKKSPPKTAWSLVGSSGYLPSAGSWDTRQIVSSSPLDPFDFPADTLNRSILNHELHAGRAEKAPPEHLGQQFAQC